MTNPLKTEHAIDWRKTAQEIEDQFQAGMIERDRYRTTLEQIASLPPERVHEATSLAYFRLHPEQEPEG